MFEGMTVLTKSEYMYRGLQT